MSLSLIELNPALIHCNCNGEILLRFDLFKTFHNFFIASIVMQAHLGKTHFLISVYRTDNKNIWMWLCYHIIQALLDNLAAF